MDICIYDIDDNCAHDCEGCPEFMRQCSLCGAEGEALFELDGETLCADCLIEEAGTEFYAGFANEMREDFREYVINANRENRLGAGY